MGASAWQYVTDYEQDLNRVLSRLRERAFAEHEYYWPHDPLSDSWDTARLASMEEFPGSDSYRESGAHSILDIETIIGPGDQDADGTLRPLTAAETERLFGSVTPNREQFDRCWANGSNEGIARHGRRWSAYCVTLHDANRPTALAIWGAQATKSFAI